MNLRDSRGLSSGGGEEEEDTARFNRDNLTDGENVDAAESWEVDRIAVEEIEETDIRETPLCYVSLMLRLPCGSALVTTSRTFVRLSKSPGKLTNLGPDARCICILCGIIPRLIIGDSIA